MRAFFNTPARQAAGWAVLGILGVLLFGAGAWFLLVGDDSPSSTSPDRATAPASVQPSATATARPSATASASASATASPSPTATATTAANQNQGNQNNPPLPTATPTAAQEPTATPMPTPSPTPVPGAYCSPGAFNPPDLRVAGAITIGGAPAPVGTNVTLLFDGAAGPSRPTTEPGLYHVDTYIGSASCRNRPGAQISVFVNGVAHPTGVALGGSASPVLGFSITIN